MMNHLPEQAANKKKAYLLGLLIGFLPILAFFLLLIAHPTELLGIFTGISVPVSLGIVQAAKIRPNHNGRTATLLKRPATALHGVSRSFRPSA